MTTNWMRFSAISLAVLGAAALRILPHPPNFAPISAMALFGGAYLRRPWLALSVPIFALLLSDAVIGFYPYMEFVYVSFALVTLLGWLSLSRRSAMRIGAAAVASSLLFYLITNFGVWLYSTGYAHTANGLIACYAAAIPFLQNTVAGDLFYSAVLFGGFALFERVVPAIRPRSEPRLVQ